MPQTDLVLLHAPAVRAMQDPGTGFDNDAIEGVIAEALGLRCTRVDVFFMIGLPRQTTESVMDTIQYCQHLFRTTDQRLSCFISPLGPFLDPGSAAFEDPDGHGYRLLAHTLAEHRQLLTAPSWEHMLNYETRPSD